MGAVYQDVLVREAREEDVGKIRDLFQIVYGPDYPHRNFLDETWLKRSIFNDDVLLLVAEDKTGGKLLGSASVLFDTGTHSDLVGEFGRLVVRPEARKLSIGKALMAKRVEFIQNRLHVGIVENRTVHPYSQRISVDRGFASVGFLPLKNRFHERESMALFARHFGQALSMRCNNPRVIPEAHGLAHFALKNCSLPPDAIIDDDSPAYPHAHDYSLEELTDTSLPPLIRIERGRVRRREIFGPVGLQYGFFQLRVRSAHYLVARERTGGPIAGAIGYILDPEDKNMRVFELIVQTDEVIGFLFQSLLDRCQNKWGIEYMEVDVSAYSPRMQRTLLELGFLPAAYIPAMVFHEVERLDVLRMVRLLVPFELGEIELAPQAQVIADQVIRTFACHKILPQVAEAMGRIPLFQGLTEEQGTRLAGMCCVQRFEADQILFRQDTPADQMLIVLEGTVRVELSDSPEPVGTVQAGESVGELSFLTGENHSATAVTNGPVLGAVFSDRELSALIRQRPDIGVTLFRNLGVGLGRKLQRMDRNLVP
ncbi:MAG: GNAT family N-acetyltransferase [Nitrospinaceae bacterium]|nr:GNAT family N-acetyltransferase [Nitrospinaceae bacterium]NIR53992.1 GNAT family N-acetyltransferase [Nitrospinaceae bacterium]NIS84411.1 GNAT family N-acetyltransferase [Nitrospinaceae bacterium]NIT81202.1 GNAT family N-acetyltransferase [Nitrospinaceae bacterium]NIU43491.1 GNAT family N-acetyltransferase [Nitrospinaceae bacterium]